MNTSTLKNILGFLVLIALLSEAGCPTTGNTPPDLVGFVDEPAPIDLAVAPPDLLEAVCTDTFVAGTTYAFLPPFDHAGACSTAQINAYLAACLSTTSTAQTCTPFKTDAANKGCYAGCINPDPAVEKTHSGVFLMHGLLFNVPGYLRLLGGSEACAAANSGEAYCANAACQMCKTKSDATTCHTNSVAKGGVCASFSDAVNSDCNNASDIAYLNTAGHETDIGKILTAFCGM